MRVPWSAIAPWFPPAYLLDALELFEEAVRTWRRERLYRRARRARVISVPGVRS